MLPVDIVTLWKFFPQKFPSIGKGSIYELGCVSDISCRYVRELERRADSFHLDIGHCSEDMLRKVGREDAAALRRLQGKQGQPESPQSVLIQHMWPRDYAAFDPKRRPRLVIGRSMCESQVRGAR